MNIKRSITRLYLLDLQFGFNCDFIMAGLKKQFTILFLLFFAFMGMGQENPDSIQMLEDQDIPKEETDAPEVIQPDNEIILYTDFKQEINLFKYHLGIDGNFSTGNVNRKLFALRTGFELDLHKIFRLSFSPYFIYGEQNKILSERELFTDLRGSLFYRKDFHYVGFTSIEKSNLRKINSRHIGAVGLAYKLVKSKNAQLTINNLILYENTDYVTNDRFKDRRLWRNSTKLQGEYKMKKDKFVISHLFYFQPAISQQNIRWNGNIIMRYMVSKKISIRAVIDDSYESLVVPGRKKNDFRLTFGIGIDGIK